MYKYLGTGFLALSLMGAGCMSSNTPTTNPPVSEPTPSTGATMTATTTPAVSSTSQEAKKDMIVVNKIADNQLIASPLRITGRARGNWFFEASFPIEIRDANNKLVAQGKAQATTDWMTTNFVAFTSKINFAPKPSTPTGTLVFKKSNASGDPARDESLVIPVTF